MKTTTPTDLVRVHRDEVVAWRESRRTDKPAA